MIVTRNWLNKQLNLTKVSNAEISVALNSLGFEVEHETNYEALNKKVVIGYVEEHQMIEGTHLSVNQVKISKTKVVQIVCGAKNVRQGQYVLVAPIGAEIGNGLTMAKRMIQGYESNGMICALDELGFKPNQLTKTELDEIYVIKNYPVKNLETLVGHSINVLGFDDYSWDVDLTLNRSDALSALQIAKELANYFNVSFKRDLNLKKPAALSLKASYEIQVDKRLAKQVNSVAISAFSLTTNDFELMATDDLWLKMSGSKTTDNSLDDLANKIAIESGQPVIFLDADLITNLKLTFSAFKDKDVVALKNDSVLVNILGKEVEPDFKVTEKTKNILAVYLNLDQALMRKQQQNLNLSNVSLQRYMKPIYPNKALLANTCLEKIFVNYQVLKAISGVKYFVGPVKTKTEIKTTLTYLNSFLGTDLTSKNVIDLFKHLDFKITKKGDELIFNVDPNRIDLVSQIDLAEEVARLYGYDNIPTTPLTIIANTNQQTNLKTDLINKLTDYLVGLGLNNIKTYSLVGQEDNEVWNLFGLKKPVKLLSPLSANHEEYRLSLASSIIEVMMNNLARGNKQLRLFEVGDVYYEKQKFATHLMIGLNGIGYDYYTLKSYVDAILRFFNIPLIKVEFLQQVEEDLPEQIHPYINAEIIVDKKTIGFIYKLNPAFENANKLGPTFLAELDLNALVSVADLTIVSQEFSKFQASTRDLSIELPKTKTYQEVIFGLIKNVKNLVNYEIVDIYRDKALIDKNRIAIAISFTFNNDFEQMDETQINESWDQILKNAKTLGLKVR